MLHLIGWGKDDIYTHFNDIQKLVICSVFTQVTFFHIL